MSPAREFDCAAGDEGNGIYIDRIIAKCGGLRQAKLLSNYLIMDCAAGEHLLCNPDMLSDIHEADHTLRYKGVVPGSCAETSLQGTLDALA